MAEIRVEAVAKTFGTFTAVNGVSFTVDHGAFFVMLGPSGCGKTTTLRMIAGFEQPSAGAIRLDGRDLVALRPNQRNIGMVFQSYALFPNMTVAQNIAFGLKIAKRPEDEIKRRVGEMLEMIKLP